MRAKDRPKRKTIIRVPEKKAISLWRIHVSQIAIKDCVLRGPLVANPIKLVFFSNEVFIRFCC